MRYLCLFLTLCLCIYSNTFFLIPEKGQVILVPSEEIEASEILLEETKKRINKVRNLGKLLPLRTKIKELQEQEQQWLKQAEQKYSNELALFQHVYQQKPEVLEELGYLIQLEVKAFAGANKVLWKNVSGNIIAELSTSISPDYCILDALTFTLVHPNAGEINWQLNAVNANIVGYHVYRSSGKGYIKLGTSFGKLQDGKLVGNFVDNELLSNMDNTQYQLRPIRFQGDELTAFSYLQQALMPARSKWLAENPVEVEFGEGTMHRGFKRNPDGTHMVSWKKNENFEDSSIIGYDLFRRIGGEAQSWEQLNSTLFPREKLYLLDTSIVGLAEVLDKFEYRLNIHYANGFVRELNTSQYEYAGKDPKVQNLKIQEVIKDGALLWKLTWDKPTRKVKLPPIKEYILFSDLFTPGEIRREASFKKIPADATEVFVPATSTGTRDYQIGIAPYMSYYGLCEPSVIKIKGVKGVADRFPKPHNLRFEDDSPNQVFTTLKWDMEVSKGLNGFRIQAFNSRDREYIELGDDKTFDANTRELKVGPMYPNGSNEFRIWAIFDNGVITPEAYAVRLGPRVSSFSKDLKVNLKRIKGNVENIRSMIHTKDDQKYLSLSWDFPQNERDLVGSFLVSSNFSTFFKGEKILKTTQQNITIPITEQVGDFTITIAAEHYAYPELYGTSETKVSILKSTYNKALWLITLGIILLGFFIMVAYLKSNKKNA